MKKLILVPLLLILSGCAVVDAFLMTKFDPNEYQLITNVRLQAQQAKEQCSDAAVSKTNAVKITTDTQMFMLYSEHIPRNNDMIGASKSLYEIEIGRAHV